MLCTALGPNLGPGQLAEKELSVGYLLAFYLSKRVLRSTGSSRPQSRPQTNCSGFPCVWGLAKPEEYLREPTDVTDLLPSSVHAFRFRPYIACLADACAASSRHAPFAPAHPFPAQGRPHSFFFPVSIRVARRRRRSPPPPLLVRYSGWVRR